MGVSSHLENIEELNFCSLIAYLGKNLRWNGLKRDILCGRKFDCLTVSIDVSICNSYFDEVHSSLLGIESRFTHLQQATVEQDYEVVQNMITIGKIAYILSFKAWLYKDEPSLEFIPRKISFKITKNELFHDLEAKV